MLNLGLLREAKMAKELDELAHEAGVILRLAWGLAEKSASTTPFQVTTIRNSCVSFT
jgi:hypothetical protein